MRKFLLTIICALLVLPAYALSGFVGDIEEMTEENKNYRQVIYTGKNLQLVLMSLKPGEEIGSEVHDDGDQFFRVDGGAGTVYIDGNKNKIKDGDAIVIPAGAKHNVVNTGKDPLLLYTIYGPPEHKDGTVHDTKAEASASKEHFDGKTSE